MRKLFLLLLIFSLSCASRRVSVPLSFNNQTECITQDPTGTIILKSSGIGKDRNASKMNAIAIGLSDVLFNGINKGQSDCYSNPIISSSSKRKEFESYFNNLFNDPAEINKFVTVTGISRSQKTINNQITLSVVMRVNHYELKNKIFSDLKIIQ
jgi:hypothetical protein